MIYHVIRQNITTQRKWTLMKTTNQLAANNERKRALKNLYDKWQYDDFVIYIAEEEEREKRKYTRHTKTTTL